MTTMTGTVGYEPLRMGSKRFASGGVAGSGIMIQPQSTSVGGSVNVNLALSGAASDLFEQIGDSVAELNSI